MNFNPNPKPAATPEPEPKKNRTNEIVLALVMAGIIIAVVVFALQNAYKMNENLANTFNPEPTTEEIMMHKCNNLQQYYGEVGLDVNIKCDRLVNALVH